jgi:hypothetical protein
MWHVDMSQDTHVVCNSKYELLGVLPYVLR